MAKPTKRPTSPYTKMCRAVEAGYRRRLWIGLTSAAIVVLVVIAAVPQLLQGAAWLPMLSAALLVIFVLVVLSSMAVLLFENLQLTDLEDAAIERGVEFLEKPGIQDRVVERIERRAKRGSEAVQLRTTLPVLLLTLIITGLFSLAPSSLRPMLTMIGLLLVLSLLREISRGNTDQIILSAIDDWRAVHPEATSGSDVVHQVPAPPQLPPSPPARPAARRGASPKRRRTR